MYFTYKNNFKIFIKYFFKILILDIASIYLLTSIYNFNLLIFIHYEVLTFVLIFINNRNIIDNTYKTRNNFFNPLYLIHDSHK